MSIVLSINIINYYSVWQRNAKKHGDTILVLLEILFKVRPDLFDRAFYYKAVTFVVVK
jgi:hypothetical protein